MEEMALEATRRSRYLGYYFAFKGGEWFLGGLLLFLAAAETGPLGEMTTPRLFAAFLALFAAPAVLVATLGLLVRMRQKAGWYLGVAYTALVVLSKTALGIGQGPLRLWYRLSEALPPAYVTGFRAFGLFSAVVLAVDFSALLAFLSPRGRDCFRIGWKKGAPPDDRWSDSEENP